MTGYMGILADRRCVDTTRSLRVPASLHLMSECIALKGGHMGLWDDSLHNLT